MRIIERGVNLPVTVHVEISDIVANDRRQVYVELVEKLEYQIQRLGDFYMMKACIHIIFVDDKGCFIGIILLHSFILFGYYERRNKLPILPKNSLEWWSDSYQKWL